MAVYKRLCFLTVKKLDQILDVLEEAKLRLTFFKTLSNKTFDCS